MPPNFLISLHAIIISVILFIGCKNRYDMVANNLKIRKVKGDYNFYGNDTIFQLNGAGIDFNSGYYFKSLVAARGNAFRTWNRQHTKQELDSARMYNSMVTIRNIG